MNPPTADSLVGTTVAQYEIVAKLGGGGMGVVYAARDTRLGRRVALKFLPPQWSHDESAKERFIREAQAASATDHRNICTIHDINSTADDRLFIVMAHYDGPTLKQRLESGRVTVDEAIDIAAQIAEGLSKAHAQGVVHRDIKPGNLMLTDDGVKILDFGLAKFADARLKLTLEGSTIGTIAYMSPEQARGEEADFRTDVWATGVVIYEMLTGAVPFKGGYPEAIAHAIKTEPPASIRAAGYDIPEALEQLVFRALHKNPGVRFQSARDLARALRLLQGRTLPLDLRTEPLPPVTMPDAGGRALTGRRNAWFRTRAAWVAAAIVAVFVGAPIWISLPVERVPVAVVPVVNQTGFAELDAYRMALTQELVAQLADSRNIRVVGYDRVLEIVRRFRSGSSDVSSREALQRIAVHSGAQVLLLPSLVYEDGAWRARVERREPQSSVTELVYESAPIVSSLMKAAVYGLVPALASGISEHFAERGPLRASIATAVLTAAGRGPVLPANRLATLDAAAAFEQGLEAYEQLEYATAREAFARASVLDPRHPLPLAWRSRVAALMRQDKDAIDAADRAAALPTNRLAPVDRLFVEAAIAEARREPELAQARYQALATRFPLEPTWLMELAGFHDRRGNATAATAAIATYRQVLDLDNRPVRAHLELCRLYSPSRSNEPVLAKEQGQLALTAYRTLGNQGGEAQALWCLTDVLRAGTDEDRRTARSNAETALQIMQDLKYPYGLARAYNYMAVVALLAERNGREAAAYFEKALTAARSVGNVFLESRILMNLGASYELFGQHSTAVNYYKESFTLFEALGNQQEAAWSQVNAAAMLIEYGSAPEQGLRDAQNALMVFQELGDRYFEVFSREVIAIYYRHTGNAEAALRELTLAEGLAREFTLADRLAQVGIELARLRFDTNDYAGALERLDSTGELASGRDNVHARIERARALTRLGRFGDAEADLRLAASAIEMGGDVGSLPLLNAARGELAYEEGQLGPARSAFAAAAAAWTDSLVEGPSVEARAYLGLIDALQGQAARGAAAVRISLEQAQRMQRVTLATRCRVFLARIHLDSRRVEDAWRVLGEVTPEQEGSVGPELRAQLHYWRRQALIDRGDATGAGTEAASIERLIKDLLTLVPEANRDTFVARPEIRRLRAL